MMNLYIYQSCLPLAVSSDKPTQVLQTTKLSFTDLSNTFFKDVNGNCWNYLGETDENYISSDSVFSFTYSGNYFTNSVNIQYPDCEGCNASVVSGCKTIYFSSKRCDSGTTVFVKVCDVSPSIGTINLLPKVGQKCGIKNPNGDDFCVELIEQVDEISTDYEIYTSAWQETSCYDCFIFKTYLANTCDDSVSGVTIFDDYFAETLVANKSVKVSTDNECYKIMSYSGITVQNSFNKNTPKIVSIFGDCLMCQNS